MGPLNYSLDVLSPMQRAMGGYFAGVDRREEAARMEQQAARQARADQMAEARFANDMTLFDQGQQDRVAQQRAAEAEAARQAAFQADIQALDGTAQSYHALALKYPEMAEGVREAWEDLEEIQQTSMKRTLGQTLAYINSGNSDKARDVLKQQADALRNSGDKETADMIDAYIGMDDGVLKDSLAMMAASLGFDEFDNFLGDPKVEYAVVDGQFYNKNDPGAGAQPIPGFVDKDGFGMSIQLPDGTVVRQGEGAAKFTEAQSKDVTYATRAEGALGTLDANDTVLTSLPDDLAGALPYGAYLQSSEYQVAQTAALEFLQAVLRKDTGAAITKDEVREYGSVYLPAPGDTPERLAHKREARQRALQAMKAGMNPDQILAKERATARTAQAGVPDPQGPKPATAYDRMGAAELKSIDINSVPPEDLDALEAAFKRLGNGQ